MLDFLALVVAVVMMNWERVEKLCASSGSGSHSKCKRVCQSDCKKTCAIILSLQTNISFALSAFLCVQGAEVCVLCVCMCAVCLLYVCLCRAYLRGQICNCGIQLHPVAAVAYLLRFVYLILHILFSTLPLHSHTYTHIGMV